MKILAFAAVAGLVLLAWYVRSGRFIRLVLNPPDIDPVRLPRGLSEEEISRLQAVFRRLAEVDDTPFEEVLEGYRKDINPVGEMEIMERVADIYEQSVAGADFDEIKKKAVYRILMSCTYQDLRDLDPSEFAVEGVTIEEAASYRNAFYGLT